MIALILIGLAMTGGVIVFYASQRSDLFQRIENLTSQRYRVDGESMEPALCDGDVVQFRDPDGELDRWQIIIFDLHLDADRAQPRQYIKRVAALPGESIEIRSAGSIVVNGRGIKNPYAKAPSNYVMARMVVPDGRYFVLGDNRNNSADSHVWADAGRSRREIDATVPAELIFGELPRDFNSCEDEP